jgi:hypothetical protein
MPADHRDAEPPTRAILYLDNPPAFTSDQRKFGAMWLVQNENEVVGGLGPEPLDHAFSVDALRELLSKLDVPVKHLLCDQMIIAGIGNMYADEALFEARIHPEKKTRKLKAKECERLYNAICHVLSRGLPAVAPASALISSLTASLALPTSSFRWPTAAARGATAAIRPSSESLCEDGVPTSAPSARSAECLPATLPTQR